MDVSSSADWSGDDGWLNNVGLEAPLLPGERLLLQALATGVAADLRTTTGEDTGPSLVRAGLVRAIVRSLFIAASEMDPQGFRVTGALIVGRLDLDDVTFTRPITFSHCTLKEGITTERATLHSLTLNSCIVTAFTGAVPVMLDQAHLDHGLNLINSHITGEHEEGAIRVSGATIGGQLICEGGTCSNSIGPALHGDGVTTGSSVSLTGTFTSDSGLGTVRLLGASIGGQLNCGGTFTNTTGPALHVDGFTSNSVSLTGTFTGDGGLGAVQMSGAGINGALKCDGKFSNSFGPALTAEGLITTYHVFLTGSFTGDDGRDAVRLLGASIGGQLICGGTFSNTTGPALAADRLTTSDHVSLTGTFTGDGGLGAVRLVRANIGGQLICGGTFSNSTGPTLQGDGLTTRHAVHLTGTFTGDGEGGAVRLLDATINGQLDCGGGTFSNSSGPALQGDGLSTSSDVFLAGTFTGDGEYGAVRLSGASINGQLTCKGGTFENANGPTLSAKGLITTSDAYLTGSFTGKGELGAVRLSSATIGGQLTCKGGTFKNTTGPALHGNGLITRTNVYLEGTFTGSGEDGAVRLSGANIGRQLTCKGGTFKNTTGPALSANGLTTGSDVSLEGKFTGSGEDGVVLLQGASIGGALLCRRPGSVTSGSTGALNLNGVRVEQQWFISSEFRADGTPERWLDIDGFTYKGLPQGMDDTKIWSSILANQTVDYGAQPWQHLAAAHRDAGHVEDATTLLIAQQDDRGERIIKENESRRRVWLHGASRFFTRYGYKASRALVGLCVLAAIGIASAVLLGGVPYSGSDSDRENPPVPILARTHDTATPAIACSIIEQIGLGLEWTVPILNTKASDTCHLDTLHPMGQWATAGTWVLRLVGWALATIAIAGYSGIVRRI